MDWYIGLVLIVQVVVLIGVGIYALRINRILKKLMYNRSQEEKELLAQLKELEAHNREEVQRASRINREEINNTFKNLQEVLLANQTHFSHTVQNQLNTSTQQIEQMRSVLENKMHALQQENHRQLEQMRLTVDEKLHTTLEQRLSDSFKTVSERLESVHKGLGEMQNLAAGVGDLKKVLTNVKTRGTWGEIQLGNILADILHPDQYQENVAVKKDAQRVEYAIKMPGGDGEDDHLWLPLDAKFPVEDYYRLLEAYEQPEATGTEAAAKALETRIKLQAKEISSKYIEPPFTTDFAIMFLPTESLYAEILRRPGLFEQIRRDYQVIIAGPTTLAAIINSLAIGFRSLALQKRSGEIWKVLGSVKSEFNKFYVVLEKTRKKIQEASNTIEEAAKRSRVMERKLKAVEIMPTEENDDEHEPDYEEEV